MFVRLMQCRGRGGALGAGLGVLLAALPATAGEVKARYGISLAGLSIGKALAFCHARERLRPAKGIGDSPIHRQKQQRSRTRKAAQVPVCLSLPHALKQDHRRYAEENAGL